MSVARELYGRLPRVHPTYRLRLIPFTASLSHPFSPTSIAAQCHPQKQNAVTRLPAAAYESIPAASDEMDPAAALRKHHRVHPY